MKFKCLVFDHDDTTVDSSRNIHYPSFVDFMKMYRPEVNISFDEYMIYNFEPGIFAMLKDMYGLNEDELNKEYDFWLDYCSKHVSKAFDGIKEIMDNHRKNGGILTVVSHSHSKNILRDYEYNNLPKPDMIFGFEQPLDELKPSPIPIYKIMKEYDLSNEDILVIDDLKPGLTMAKNANVPFCASAWCYEIAKNAEYMKQNADYYCKTVEELAKLVK